jgi:hypothetical protein
MDTLRVQPAGSGCEINPTGQGPWRCHTHGSPALRRGPCLATSSDRHLALLILLTQAGSAMARGVRVERRIRAAAGAGEARIWASQAAAGRLVAVNR